MITKLRTYKLECNRCPAEVTFTSSARVRDLPENLPDGWVAWRSYGDDSDSHLCPKCKAKEFAT